MLIKLQEATISNDLVLEASLQSFFFDQLDTYNKQSSSPLSSDIIFYASRLLDRYAICDNFFEIVDGKIKDKVLGLKLLGTDHKKMKSKVSDIRDVGDTALMLCGFFPSAIENRIVSVKYYYDIGTVAYQKLNGFVPEYLDKKNFYAELANLFYRIAQLLTVVSESFNNTDAQFLIQVDQLKVG